MILSGWTLHLIIYAYQRTSSVANVSFSFGCSVWLSRCKILYYTLLSWLYGLVGSCAHLAMVNSSWTKSHIDKLWKIPERTKRVYPPCDTSALQVHLGDLRLLMALILLFLPIWELWPCYFIFRIIVKWLTWKAKYGNLCFWLLRITLSFK